MTVTRDMALSEAFRLLKVADPDHAEEILQAIEGPEKPSAEFLACLEAAKAGAQFQVSMHQRKAGRRHSRSGYLDIDFDSRTVAPKPAPVPAVVEEANRITYERVPERAFRPPVAKRPRLPRGDDPP